MLFPIVNSDQKGNVQLLKLRKKCGKKSSVFEGLHMWSTHACFEDDLVPGIPEGILLKRNERVYAAGLSLAAVWQHKTNHKANE